MNKTLHKNDTLTTPFIVNKDWRLTNVVNDDLLLMESGNPVALEFVEYSYEIAVINSSQNISLEQQTGNQIKFQEGLKTTGLFYPDQDPVNLDSTYKRLVYAQIRTMFYNNYRDPTKIWGTEKLDFDQSGMKRFLADEFRIFTVPTDIFGEKIVENSVIIIDATGDNDFIINDDGNGNLFAGKNLFSRRQELGNFINEFGSGSDPRCNGYFALSVPSLTSSLVGDTFLTASLSWSYATPITWDGFVVERSIDSGSTWSTLAILSGSVYSMLDYPLVFGFTYSYKMHGFIACGIGVDSNITTPITPPILIPAYDSFETYVLGESLDELDGADAMDTNAYWNGPYKEEPGIGIIAYDYFENYALSAQLNGLNSGSGWRGPYKDATSQFNYILASDSFETYTIGSNLDGLNDGSGFNGAYAAT
jgi:hypothetical protein